MEMHLFVAMVIGMFDLELLDPIPALVSANEFLLLSLYKQTYLQLHNYTG